MKEGASLASLFATRRNNFDLIRLAAALLVLASHAWVLTGRPEAEPVARALGHSIDGGGLAVAVFFVLSGFLIARSAQVHGPLDFLRARALRIWPGLAAAVLVQTLVLGPVFTSLPLRAYFTDAATWSALARSLVFSPPVGLPGVFAGNPLPLAVNGSLWTLRIEAVCYGGMLALSVAGGLRRGGVLAPLALGWVLLAATVAARAGLLPPALAALRVVSIADCLLNFVMGAAFWVYAGRIPHRAGLAALALVVLVLAARTPAAPVALHLALPYLTLWLGLCRPVLRGPMVDVSYGAYLYAFPIQQALMASGAPACPVRLIALAVLPTLVCAFLSRRLVETPALRRRGPR